MTALGEATSSLPSRLGRYELISQIGQGGMAEVQLALQRGPAGFEKLVVVKLVHAHLATQKAFVDMLLDEARVAALVKHPNVVDIYDLGQVDGRFFIAMEYLEGEPLLAVLRAGREGQRLDALSTARLIADTAEGLDAAHELRSMSGDLIGLVHHDVSLGNIVVLYNGQVKLVDFGVSKAASMTMATAAPGQIQGKFAYMAPEKLRGNPGDRRSDIWSLGVVLWEALTLRRLFRGGNDSDTMKQVLEAKIPAPSTVNAEVPADLDPVVMRALQRAPEDRYPTAKEMADALEEVLRKQGYGGRNDLIAKYMRATFETHIVARKKLLQEVSSKGRASAAVLEAAFDEAARQSNVDLSGKFVMPEGTPQRPGRKTAGLPSYTVAAAMAGSPGAAVEDAGATTIDTPAERRSGIKPIHLAIAAGGALLLVIVLAFALGGDGGDGRQLQAALTDAAPVITPPPAPDAAEAIAPPADAAEAAGSGSGSADLELPPDHVGSGSGSAHVRRPPPPRPNAVELQRQGLKEFVSGDYRTALTTLKRAQAANPGYAPTWRTLGMVYEKLGQKGAAKSAFQRYLTLAPKAPDAAAIRARIGS